MEKDSTQNSLAKPQNSKEKKLQSPSRKQQTKKSQNSIVCCRLIKALEMRSGKLTLDDLAKEVNESQDLTNDCLDFLIKERKVYLFNQIYYLRESQQKKISQKMRKNSQNEKKFSKNEKILRKKHHEILEFCQMGKTAENISKKLKIPISTLYKDLRKLIEYDFLKKIGPLYETNYQGYTLGKTPIVSSQDDGKNIEKIQGKLLIRLHGLRFKSSIRSMPNHFWKKLMEGNWAEIQLKYNVQYHRHLMLKDIEIFCVATTKHLIVELPEIKTYDLEEGLMRAWRQAKYTFDFFEKKYAGLKLGDYAVKIRNTRLHIGLLEHPLAWLAHKNKWFYIDDRVTFDASTGISEAEMIHKALAYDDGMFALKNYSNMIKSRIDFKQINDDLGDTKLTIYEAVQILKQEAEALALSVQIAKAKEVKKDKDDLEEQVGRMFG